MRRRLDLAASLVAEPRILFLDEPTTGLDPRSRAEVWSVIRELLATGTTILLTTQYLEEADQLADRIAVIDNGRIVADDTPNALKRQVGSERLLLRLQRPEDLSRAGPLLSSNADRADAGPHLDADTGEITMAIHHPDQLRHALVRLHAADIAVEQVELRTPTLDDVFFALTKAAA
jgi:ABC-2 type transport system ATP-binding protein